MTRLLSILVSKIKPWHVDGLLFLVGSFFGAISIGFAPDNAYQYFPARFVFLTRVLSFAISSSCMSLITFRNKAYAQSQHPEPPQPPKP